MMCMAQHRATQLSVVAWGSILHVAWGCPVTYATTGRSCDPLTHCHHPPSPETLLHTCGMGFSLSAGYQNSVGAGELWPELCAAWLSLDIPLQPGPRRARGPRWHFHIFAVTLRDLVFTHTGRHGHPGPRGCCSPSGQCGGRRWALPAAPGKQEPADSPMPMDFLVPAYLPVQAAEPLGRQCPSLPAPCLSLLTMPAPCPLLPAPCPSLAIPVCCCLLPSSCACSLPIPTCLSLPISACSLLIIAHACLLPPHSCLFPAHPCLLLARCCPARPCLLPTP